VTDMIASRDKLLELGAGFVITKRTYPVHG
jgi:hypothetical protein